MTLACRWRAATWRTGNPLWYSSQYTGREFDTDTGLLYLRARYYNPSAGRFLSEDPIGFDGGGNFYGYVTNNPTNLADPFGWLPKGKDKWYGYNDQHFHKWFHRCWKEPGDPDATKDQIEEAYDEWLNRGRPQNGNCWNGPTAAPIACKQKTMFEIQQEYNSATYMVSFWKDILIGDVALGAVGTAGAAGLLGSGAAGAAGGGGAASPPPIPMPAPPTPLPPVALRPAS